MENKVMSELLKLQSQLKALKSKPEYKVALKEANKTRVKDYSDYTSDARALMACVIASNKSVEVFKMVNFTPKFIKL